jgi:hypothetical protein
MEKAIFGIKRHGGNVIADSRPLVKQTKDHDHVRCIKSLRKMADTESGSVYLMSWLKAFKWKRSSSYEIINIASSLGIERRLNYRIKYPERGAIGDLPWVSFAGHNFKIQNISTGGCCLLDPEEILGPAIGQDVKLSFHWQKDSQDITSRIVSRVDSRRHIQFMNISDRNQGRIRNRTY